MIESHEYIEPFEKSILKLTAGGEHHIKELQKLESMLYSGLDTKKLYDNLVKFLEKEFPEKTVRTVSIKDLQKIDEFIKAQTLNKITIVEQYIVRAFVIGNIIEERSMLSALSPKEINIEALPANIQTAVKEYGFNPKQVEALTTSVSHAAQHLTGATNDTIGKVQSLTTDNILKRGSRKELAEKLRHEFMDDDKELNRNWNLVAIHEAAYAFNNGYLLNMKPGQWVVGISMPDRCETCGKLIDGKVYPLIDVTNQDMKYDEMDPKSKEYQRRNWLSENTVWLYKDNYGRSSAKKKRTENGMVDREKHELNMPCCPLHVRCRCSYSKFNPEYQYVTKDGHVRMKAMDEKAYKEFCDSKIKPVKDKLKEYEIII
jgi:hypothetical protein